VKLLSLGFAEERPFSHSLLGEYILEGVKAVNWGVEHEKEATDNYRTTFGKIVSPAG